MLNTEILQKIEKYVKELFAANFKSEVLYHNIRHTIEVVEAVKEIGLAEGITSEDMEILVIASWFHDTGHLHCCSGHEEQSTTYARNYLESKSYPVNKINQIIECIRATKIPQQPNNKLQEIICDADLHHLGEKDIKERGDLLRQELELSGIKKLSDIEWLSISIEFFNYHHFFTDYAKKQYGNQKEINLERMKKVLKELIANQASVL